MFPALRFPGRSQRVGQFAGQYRQGRGLQGLPKPLNQRLKARRIGQNVRGIRAVIFALMPENALQFRCAQGQAGHKNRVVKQHGAGQPFIQTGAAVGTGNQTDLPVKTTGIGIGKGGRQAYAAAETSGKNRAVRIDGLAHRLPAAHAQHEAMRVPDRRNVIKVAAPGHVGLADHQKGIHQRMPVTL